MSTEIAVQEIAPGVTVSSSMTPEQRFAVVAKAMGAPVAAPKHLTFSGPQGHPHVVVPDAEAGTIAGKAPPPTPAQLEAANKAQGNRVAEFDAEMRAAGKQITPRVATGEIDQAGLDALTEAYQTLVRPLLGKTDAASVAAVQRWRSAFESDVKKILDGNALTPQQLAKLKGTTGRVDTLIPKTREAAPTAKATQWSVAGKLTAAGQKMQSDLLAEWKALPEAEQRNPMVKADYDMALGMTMANERGLLSAGQFHPASLSGYTLPAGEYTPDTIQDLAKARAAGLSQVQVDTAIRNLRGEK